MTVKIPCCSSFFASSHGNFYVWLQEWRKYVTEFKIRTGKQKENFTFVCLFESRTWRLKTPPKRGEPEKEAMLYLFQCYAPRKRNRECLLATGFAYGVISCVSLMHSQKMFAFAGQPKYVLSRLFVRMWKYDAMRFVTNAWSGVNI